MKPIASPLSQQILWILAAMVLSILAPLLLHEATGGTSNSRTPWWSLIIIILAGGAYAGVIASRQRRLFGMVLWLFTYIFMGLAPYVQYRLDQLPTTVQNTKIAYMPAAGLLVIACIIATLLGSGMATRKPPFKTIRNQTVDRQRANLLTGASLIVFVYYGNAVGFGSFILSRTEFSAIRESVWAGGAVSGLLTGTLHMSLLVSFLSQMAVRSQMRAARKPIPLVVPLFSGMLLFYTVNPIGSSRTLVGTVLLAALATTGAFATLARFRIMAVFSLMGMLFLFPAASLFRHTTDATLEIEGPIASLTSGDYDAFAQLATTFDFIDHHGLTYGFQMLGVLLFWVPRSLWASKPEDTGIILGEYMNYGFTNLSAPIWAEFLINFGTVSAVIGMGVIGYAFRRWDISTNIYLQTWRVPPVTVSAVVFYMLIVLRGSLLNAVSYLLVIVLASWFVTNKRSHSQTVCTQPREQPTVPARLITN